MQTSPPPVPARRERLISYRLSLVLVTSLLVATSGGLIVLNDSLSTRRTVNALTSRLFGETTHRAVVRTRSRVRLAVPAIDLLQRRLSRAPALTDDRDGLAVELLDVLRANPEITWVTWSDAAGSFTGAYRTAQHGLRLNESTIHDGRTELNEWDVDAQDHRALARHEADTHYDPRTRPFYRLAVERRARAWTDPYVFFDQNAPGITCAAPVYGADGTSPRGVVTVDFDLDELSEFLARRHFSPGGRLFVFTPDGTLVAAARMSVVRRGPDNTPELATARTVDDPLLRAYYDAAVAHGVHADTDGREVDQQFAFRHDGRTWLAAFNTFELDAGMHWIVGAAAPESDFLGDAERSRYISLLISAVALAVSLLLAALFATRMSSRLAALADEMGRVGEFRLDDARPASPTLLREIALMNRALGAMKQGLRSFASYVPRDLVRAVLASGQEASLGGRLRPMTIFFSDIAGFTSVAEEMAPDALVAMLGGYLDGMTHVIGGAGGTVDKFIGDGIMAFWGAPAQVDDHAARACEAALGCQRELARMQREGSAEMKRLATRIGLATGEVLVGNIGTPERLNYTVMGDVVNLASRLEGLNKQYGTRVMASEETVRAANGRVVARAIDVVAVKGKARGVKVYELTALASEGDARAERVGALSDEALTAYLARDFARAEARWAAVLEELPGDRAAALMRDRAREYGAHPPPAEWNGVYVAHEK